MSAEAVSATLLARAVVARLLEAGVREVVVAPGSRNAPLSYAVHAAAEAGRLRLHIRIDERTAAFLALGLGKVGAPAAVVCTSGTAAANLHPAVLEAAHAGVPLVVLTADRPASLRGTGASQTTDQVRMYGTAAVFHDVAAPADLPSATDLVARLGRTRRDGGPVHLNVQLVPPLTPDPSLMDADPSPLDADPSLLDADPSLLDADPSPLDADPSLLDRGPRTVVVAGDDAGPAARRLAEQGGWPLLAEPTSGARTGARALRTYRLLLGGPLAGEVERVVVAGHPTLSRPVTRLLERADVEVVSLRTPGRWPVRPHPVASEHDALAVAGGPTEAERAWTARWQEADRATGRALDALLAAERAAADGRPTALDVAGAVARAVPPGGLLLVGASNPVRDLDLMHRPTPVGERRLVLANRGLAGIDGTLSTAVGAALGRDRSTRSLLLVGDVTFLHDMTALVLGPDEPRPDLTVVVVNDDGGSIFAVLEQGDPAYAASFERLFATPHGVDLAALCAATRTPHWRVESLPELEHALASPAGGIEVVEVRVRRDDRRALDARTRALVDPT